MSKKSKFTLEIDDKQYYQYVFDDKWEQIESYLSVSRVGCAAVVVRRSKVVNWSVREKERLIVFGGGFLGSGTKVVESCNINDVNENPQWKQLSHMPKALFDCTAVNLDNKYVYVFGANHINKDEMGVGYYEYNVKDDNWNEDLPSMDTKRYLLACVCIKKTLYAIGGRDGKRGSVFDTVEYYDTDNDSAGWILLKANMNSKRSGCCAVVINSIIYVIGGRDENNYVLNTIEMYDTTLSDETGEWVKISVTMESRRVGAAAVVFKHYIIVMGGIDDNHNILNTIEIFNTKTEQFVSKSGGIKFPSMTAARLGCAVVLTGSGDNELASDKKIVVVGGEKNRVADDTAEMINVKSITNTRPDMLMGDYERGEDLLKASTIANALADTIAFKDLNTPFVLGILGNWGSGKSFTFNLIKEGLADIQRRDCNVEDFQYCGHIYIVNFNAWTYSKVNLWASLMNEILTSLNTQLELERLLKEIFGKKLHKGVSLIDIMEKIPKEDFSYLNEQMNQEAFQKRLKDTIRNNNNVTEVLAVTINTAYTRDKRDLDNSNWQLKQLEYSLATKKDNLRSVVAWKDILEGNIISEGLRNILAKAYERYEEKERQVNEKKEREEVKSEETVGETTPLLHVEDEEAPIDWNKTRGGYLDVINSSWRFCDGFLMTVYYVREGKLTPLWLAVFSVSILVVFLVPFVIKSYKAVSLVIIPILSAIRARYNECSRVLGEDVYDLFKHAKETADIESKNIEDNRIKQRYAQVKEEEKRITEKKREISDIERRLVVREGESIDNVVKKRLESKSYESKLGIIHQAQSDLKRISSAMKRNEKFRKEIFPRGQPRIVLFIDDLDRCPPDKVVQTLEAIQLLVRTDLFVVVVAIDVEYVTLSLEKAYKNVLIKDAHPSGIDYIEKIIQLPYQMCPISEEGMWSYLKGQMTMEGRLEEKPRFYTGPSTGRSLRMLGSLGLAGQPRGIKEGDEDVSKSGAEEERKDSGTESSSRGESGDDSPTANGSNQNEAGSDRTENNPNVVIPFSNEELTLLTKVCLFADVSPRSGKRLVNVFKLLKAIWSRNHMVPTGAEKGVCVLLLSMCASPSYEIKSAVGVVFNVAKQTGVSQEEDISMTTIRSIVLESLGKETQEGRRFVKTYDEIVTNTTNEDPTITRKNIILISCFTFIGCSEKYHLKQKKEVL